MHISVFGLGYVGSVTAACLAELGHTVIGVDIHAPKVKALRAGRPPVNEPQLDALVQRHVASGRLRVTMDTAEAVAASTCSLVTVGTPSGDDGRADLSAVERCVESIAAALEDRPDAPPHAVVVRSTVPPGTTRRLLRWMARRTGRTLGQTLLGGMNPEFLREGVAISDFFAPSVVVCGADDPASHDVLRRLYDGIDASYVAAATAEAEMVKYANNAFHALKIAFANEVGRLADAFEVDGARVMDVLCLDEKLNISPHYLRPGFAYGGSCLPKDLRSIRYMAREHTVDLPLLASVGPSNDAHIDRAAAQILAHAPERVGLLGMAFKPGTDDLRESPSLHLVRRLRAEGIDVRMYDRHVRTGDLLGANRRYLEDLVPAWDGLVVESAEAAIAFGDVVVVTNNEPAYFEAVAHALAQPLGGDGLPEAPDAPVAHRDVIRAAAEEASTAAEAPTGNGRAGGGYLAKPVLDFTERTAPILPPVAPRPGANRADADAADADAADAAATADDNDASA
jgi:GDP-mannose 6-dehydrogenase